MDSSVRSSADVGTGMQDEHVAAHRFCPLDFLCEKFNREGKDLRFYGIGEIDDIRGVDDEAGNIVLAHPFLCLWDAELIHRFTSGVLRRAGIKHKGVGSVGKRFLDGTVHHRCSAHAHMGADQERLASCFARGFTKWIHRFSISVKIFKRVCSLTDGYQYHRYIVA